MPIGDLVRHIVIAVILLVLAAFGLKTWNKQKLETRIVRDLRSLTNPTASFEARTNDVARSALFRTMGLLHEAKSKLDMEPAEILSEAFHGDDEGALFGPKETGRESSSDPKAQIIGEGLLRNYTHCTNLGLFSDGANLMSLGNGEPATITKGASSGENAVISYIVDPGIASGIENIVPNMVISSPGTSEADDEIPNEFDITSAKNLIGALYRARLIDRDAEDRLTLHYERFGSPTGPEPQKTSANDVPEDSGPNPEPQPDSNPQAKPPAPEEEDCPFDTPLE